MKSRRCYRKKQRTKRLRRKRTQRGGNINISKVEVGQFIKLNSNAIFKIIKIDNSKLTLQHFGKITSPKETLHILELDQGQLRMNGAELIDEPAKITYMTEEEKNAAAREDAARVAAAEAARVAAAEAARVAYAKAERVAAAEAAAAREKAEKAEAQRFLINSKEKMKRYASIRRVEERKGPGPKRKYNIGDTFLKEDIGHGGTTSTNTITIIDDAYIVSSDVRYTGVYELDTEDVETPASKLEPGSEIDYLFEGVTKKGEIREYAYKLSNGSIYSESTLDGFEKK